jgi:hypothetical protein
VGWSANSGHTSPLSPHKDELTIPITVGSWTFVAVVYNEKLKSSMLYVDGQVLHYENVTMVPGGPDLIIGGNGM